LAWLSWLYLLWPRNAWDWITGISTASMTVRSRAVLRRGIGKTAKHAQASSALEYPPTKTP